MVYIERNKCTLLFKLNLRRILGNLVQYLEYNYKQ